MIEDSIRSEFKTHDALGCKPCNIVFNGKSSLNPHMQEASDMENDDQKGKSSDELTPNEPERKDDDEVDSETKRGLRNVKKVSSKLTMR